MKYGHFIPEILVFKAKTSLSLFYGLTANDESVWPQQEHQSSSGRPDLITVFLKGDQNGRNI